MNRKGIHLFNTPTVDTLDKLWSIDWDSFVLLHFQRGLIPEIRRRYPNAKIIVRAYWENWTVVRADDAARQVSTWWLPDCAPYGSQIYLMSANEQNLRDEGHPLAVVYPFKGLRLGGRYGIKRERWHPRDIRHVGWNFEGRVLRVPASDIADTYLHDVKYPPRQVYEDIRDWNVLFAKTIKQLVPSIQLVFPALSWGHSDDLNDAGYVGCQILEPAFAAYDWNVGAHDYWNDPRNRTDRYYGRRYEIFHALYPQAKLFCTEAGANESLAADNAEDYKAWLDELPPYMVEHFSPAWFIWRGQGAMDGWSIDRKPRTVQMLKDYKAPLPIPDPPLPKDYQKIADSQYPAKNINAIGIAAMVLRAKIPEPQKAIAIVLAESGGNPQAINVNPNGTVDRGLWQLNSKWYAKYSDECAFNPMCSTLAAAQIVKEWNGYGAWSSYKQGTYLKYMNIAALALAALGST